MNIDEIRKMVSSDILMDKTELDTESMKTPQLHNKYLVFHTDEKLILGKMQSDLNVLRRDKWLYYTGKMDEEDLKSRNWEPFNLNILKTDIEKFMDSDTDIDEWNVMMDIVDEEEWDYNSESYGLSNYFNFV